MRRVLPMLLPLLLPLVLAAGCDGGGLPPGPAGPVGTAAQLRAGFPLRGLADTIEIDVVDRLPLRTAELVAPGGAVTPAGNIDVAASPRIASGQWTAGDPWRSALLGGGSALSMPDANAGAALHSEQQLLATVSTAEITLPDPVAYRRDWARYRIRLTFGTPPGDVETREIAAPAPSPQASPQAPPGS